MTGMHITALVENTASGHALLAEHGLACSIVCEGYHVLLDCGQGLVLAHNARRMKIPLDDLDAVVLSHGHYDHTGGLEPVLQQNPQATLYAHPDCLLPRYARRLDGAGVMSVSRTMRQAMERHQPLWIHTLQPTKILPRLTATGPIPRVTDFEDTGGPFFLDPDCRQADLLADDQALFFDSSHGTVVLLGCAHAGVINTLLYIQQLTDGKPIHTVLGGMHLVRASAERLQCTIEQLRAACGSSDWLPPIAPAAPPWQHSDSAFPQQCLDFCVGTRLEFAGA